MGTQEISTMGARRFFRWALAAATCGALALGPAVTAFAWQLDSRGRPSASQVRAAYDTGFREGLQAGQDDSQSGRSRDIERDGEYRAGDRGYDRSWGSRDAYRIEFRRGFEAGYRQGSGATRQDRRDEGRDRRWTRGYQEPATARGYRDGYDKGQEDLRDGDRYDPVRHGDYKSADNGYEREYGSRDAYRNNYRVGFRQGYEDGYRRR
jgi:hypothetical protein